MGQDIASKVGSRDGTAVRVTKPGGEVIGLVVTIHHVAQALWQLDVELDPEDCESLDAARDQASKIKVELNLDKINFLAIISEGSIHHR